MNASVRPLPTKLAAAFLAAGVISTGALIAPDKAPLPVVSSDVANASVITDALYRLGDVVNGAAYGYAITQDAGSSLPFDVATAFAIAAQNPTLAPSLFSWLVNRYANPADDYLYWTYPWSFKVDSLEVVAGALPFPLGPSDLGQGVVIDAANAIANAINGFLGGVLPDPTAGVAATDAFWETDIGKTVVAANLAVTAPVYALYSTAYYLGYLPADLEATFESAIQNPAEIPGLLSNLVYGLVSSDGLVGDLIWNFSAPLRALPGPIGELANNVVDSLYTGIDNVLSVLPAPITPTPFASGAANVDDVSDDTTADLRVSSIPDPTVSLDNAVTLRVAAPVTDPVVTPDTPLPTEPTEPDTTGGSATGLVKTSDSGPLTNVVRDSIKVEPGDTFAGSGTVTGSEPESGTVTTGTTTDPVATATPDEPSGPAESTDRAANSNSGDAGDASPSAS
ncbi:hypothetical protein H7K45_11450 [Mycobacterium yunnanensis]|uniref:PE-PPE domain-containing protein n=1 Tax=Mycobacterium yunnanensis TaxID=368477 RepID=A0A9X2Z1D5_9MYCO|nr:hypothetical protein [Mycobacterium yunnanensis]MCV7421156.1 hypothetical protein [Mycobacterium yunnanensis]